MLRICGVTFIHTTNYGSCLQAYALQEAIDGISVERESFHYELLLTKFLDYPRVTIRDLFVKKRHPKNKIIKQLIFKYINKIYRIPFIRFETKHMHYTKCHSMADLGKLNKVYDAFVCGSDVIWSPEFGFLPTFFLNFAEKYHFSYAASFGKTEYVDDVVRKRLKYLSTFNRISLREASAKPIVANYVQCPIDVVADPVFLLKREQWDSIA